MRHGRKSRGILLMFGAGGIEDGSDHRLPHGYEIRKKETEGRNELGLGEWSDHMRKGA